jgi:hypothetical protein
MPWKNAISVGGSRQPGHEQQAVLLPGSGGDSVYHGFAPLVSESPDRKTPQPSP